MIATKTAALIGGIRVLLIEDHAVVRAGLRLLLESRLDLVIIGEAATFNDALALAECEQPDVILLDLDLGAENGLDLLPGLLAVASQTRVLILTGLCEVEAHRQAICRGAMGVVLKEQAPEVLLKAIQKVHAGEVWLDRTMLASVLGELIANPATPVDAEATHIAMLTGREREVIVQVGQGLRNKQIAHRLGITETTVRHHLSSIFDKLGVTSRLELVIFAHRRGFTM